MPKERVARTSGVVKPNLFIVGAARSGTTSLYRYLRTHPQVFMPIRKEPHFFSQIEPDPRVGLSQRPVAELEEYQALFRGAGEALVVGEASPSYLWAPSAAEAIRRFSPEAKIVIILRDPVQRAFSHYLQNRPTEKRSFLEAVQDEEYEGKSYFESQYCGLGLYAAQVQRYLEAFPRTVRVLIYEEFFSDLHACFADLLDFLGVDPSPAATLEATVHNPYAVPRNRVAEALLRSSAFRIATRSMIPRRFRPAAKRGAWQGARKPEMEPAARAYLEERYAPDVARLRELLGRDLPW